MDLRDSTCDRSRHTRLHLHGFDHTEPFARRYWPGESALGKVFYYGIQDPYNAPDLSYETGWDNRYPQPFPLRIVGVVEPVNQLGLAPEDPLQFYTIMGRFSWLAVQMRGDVMAGLSGLREAVEATDPELSVTAVEPAKTRIRRLASATRFQLVLSHSTVPVLRGAPADGRVVSKFVLRGTDPPYL